MNRKRMPPVISAVSNKEVASPLRAGYEWQENALGGSTSQMNEIGEDIVTIEFGIFTKPYSPMAAGPGI